MSSLLTTTNYLSNRATYIVCFASVIATQEIPPDFCKENTYSEGLYCLVAVVGEMFKNQEFSSCLSPVISVILIAIYETGIFSRYRLSDVSLIAMER